MVTRNNIALSGPMCGARGLAVATRRMMLVPLLLVNTAQEGGGAVCSTVNEVLGKGSDLHVGSAPSSAGCCDMCHGESQCAS
jgi:hypothetical protein